MEHYHELAEAARYDQVLQDLNGEVEKAKAMLAKGERYDASAWQRHPMNQPPRAGNP